MRSSSISKISEDYLNVCPFYRLKMEGNENFVPRVNQLDAEELDQEIMNIFKGGFQNAFKYFLR